MQSYQTHNVQYARTVLIILANESYAIIHSVIRRYSYKYDPYYRSEYKRTTNVD